MCGITGWRSFGTAPSSRPDRATLRRMNDAIAHRGPDSDGIFLDADVGLAMRRLAIIDLSAKGNQPMTSTTGKSTIVFNGEVYNFKELRSLPAIASYRFRSDTDTETVLALYEAMGERCVEHLRGMFAFAIWDHDRKSLFLARDRVGKKPLNYVHDAASGTFLFASEIKALLKHPLLAKRTVDEFSLRLYTRFGYVPAPRTIWREVRKLPAGHTLTLSKDGAVSISQYWDLEYDRKMTMPEADAVRRLRELLEESVRLRMISDVPLGAFLSGGIDSSAVVAMMAKASDRPVKTFSVGFEEGEYDELSHARVVAQAFGTDHKEIMLRPDFLKDLPSIMRSYDEPFADGSCVPTWYIARETRKHVTVALNGDGGDESFAGYARYVNGMRARFLRLPPLPASRTPRTGNTRIAELLGMGWKDRYYSLHTIFEQRHLFPTAMQGADRPFDRFYDRPSAMLDKWLYTDVKTYLPDDLLVKVDIATMAHSLEGRSPLLDHRVMEFAAALPTKWKLDGSATKVLLRKAMTGVLPREILEKPKHGFAVPIPEWMRGELGLYARQELLESDSAIMRRMDRDRIRQLFSAHGRGAQHGYRLWSLLMLREWEKANAPAG